jgi:hypothetical protein
LVRVFEPKGKHQTHPPAEEPDTTTHYVLILQGDRVSLPTKSTCYPANHEEELNP